MSPRSDEPSKLSAAPSTYGGAPLQRVLTDATSSNATANDLVGPGRMVGNLIFRGGKYLEPLFTKLSLVLGGGPRKPLETVLKSLRCARCSQPYFGNKSSLPPREASFDNVLRALFIRSCSCAHCGAARGFYAPSDKTSKVGRKFTSLLRGSNHSSQYHAILYVTALCALLPELPVMFMKHKTTCAIAILRYQIEQQPDADLDFLLAPSHCALAVLGQLEIHSISKEFLALTARVSEAKTWDSFKALTGRRALLYDTLFPFFNSPETDIFTAVLICAGIHGREIDFACLALDKWHVNAFYEEQWTDQSPLKYDDLAQHLTHSENPVLNSMVPALLLAIRENLIAQYRIRIQYDIGKGRTPRKMPHTLDVLQSPDWERLLRSWLELIDRHDEEFMEYALEDPVDDYRSDEDTDDAFSEENTDGEDEGMIHTSSVETQMVENGSVAAITLAGSSDEDSTDDDYMLALSVLVDGVADVDVGDII